MKKLRTVKVSITDEEWQKFCEYADRNGYIRGGLIAKLIREAIKQEEEK